MKWNRKNTWPTRWARLKAGVALLCLSGMPSAAVAAGAGGVLSAPVYITLQASGGVAALPQAQPWPGLPGAHYNAIGPRGLLMLVSSVKAPGLYLVDVDSGKTLASFAIGPVAQGVAIGPKARWGLAVSAGSGTVAVIDLQKRVLVKTLEVGKAPHNVRFTDDGKRAFVTLQGEGKVAVLDMVALKKVDEFAVPGVRQPHNLDLSADGRTLWIRGFVGKVAAIDLATHQVKAVIPVGLGHAGIDVAPVSGLVFTAAVADHRVDVIDPTTFEVIKRIDVGQGPHGIRASRDGKFVYTGVTATNKLAVIDTATLEVVKQLPVDGKLPFWVSVQGND